MPLVEYKKREKKTIVKESIMPRLNEKEGREKDESSKFSLEKSWSITQLKRAILGSCC